MPKNKGKLTAYREIDTYELTARNLSLTGSATVGGNVTVTGVISGSDYQGLDTEAVLTIAASGSTLLSGSVYLTGSTPNIEASQSGQVIQFAMGDDINLTSVTATSITGSTLLSGSDIRGPSATITNLSGSQASFSGNLYVNGDLSGSIVSDNFTAITITGSSIVSGSQLIGNNLSLSGTASIGGDLEVTGSISGSTVRVGSGGILIGGDVTVYRGTIDLLQTDNDFKTLGKIVVGDSIFFGTGEDTNLYRGSANILCLGVGDSFNEIIATGSMSGSSVQGQSGTIDALSSITVIGATSVSGSAVQGQTNTLDTINATTISATGTISGSTIQGQSATLDAISGVTVVGSTSISGSAVQGQTGTIDTVNSITTSGSTIQGQTGTLDAVSAVTVIGSTSVSGSSIQGQNSILDNVTSVNITGSTISGSAYQGDLVTGFAKSGSGVLNNDVYLQEGSNVTMSQSGQYVTINSTPGGILGTGSKGPYTCVVYSGSDSGGPYFTEDNLGNKLYSGSDAEALFESTIASMTTGGILHIRPAIYSLDDEIIIDVNDIVIEGEGKDTILQPSSTFRIFEISNNHDITIRDIFFDSQNCSGWSPAIYAINYCRRIIIENCYFDTSGIEGRSFNQGVIKNNKFTSGGGINLRFGSGDNIIDGNVMDNEGGTIGKLINIGEDGPVTGSLTVTASGSQADVTIHSVAGYYAGMSIKITNDDGDKEYPMPRVASIASNTLTLERVLTNAYTTGSNSYTELGCPRNKIINNTLIGGGIRIYDNNDDCVITNNYIDVGESVNGEGIYGYVSDRVVVCNNTLIGPTTGSDSSHGIDFAYGDDLTRNGNCIYGFGKGMSMDGTIAGTITGNVIDGVDGMGMDLQFAVPSNRRMIVSSNIIKSCTGTGIVMTKGVRHSIIGNIIFSNNAGITLYDDGGVGSDGNVIGSNIIIDNTTHAISIDDSNEINISDNYIADNGTIGIYMQAGSTFINIVGNNIMDNGQHGIHITGSDYIVVKNNIIKDNDSGLSQTYDGVYLEGADYCNIENNTFKDNDRNEINVSNALCNDNIIKNNTFRGSDHVAVIADSGTDTTIQYNIGYVTENDGYSSGSSGVQVAHGLASVPRKISLTASGSNPQLFSTALSGSANFYVYHSGSATQGFYWEAEV